MSLENDQRGTKTRSEQKVGVSTENRRATKAEGLFG